MSKKYDEQTETMISVVMEEYGLAREKAIEYIDEHWVTTGRVDANVVGVLLLTDDVKWLQVHLRNMEDDNARRIYQTLNGVHLPDNGRDSMGSNT